MCESVSSQRPACRLYSRNRIKPLKLSRWELPVSRSKTYWDGVIADMEKKYKRPPLTNPRQLRKLLSTKYFDIIAPMLGMPIYTSSDMKKDTRLRYLSGSGDHGSSHSEADSQFDLIVHPPTIEDSYSAMESRRHQSNPYAMFLKKPRRKVVVWRELTEEDLRGYDPEATFEKRAARLMDGICKDFCDWLKSLGKNDHVTIDEETLKDMFEINFTAEACRATKISVQEMPTVPDTVAEARHCYKSGKLRMTRNQIYKDLKVEKRPKRVVAFGKNLPRELRFVPPKGRLAKKWLRCPNVPRDVEAMDIVWKDIMHLDSVRAFAEYLSENPKDASPTLLGNLREREKRILQAKNAEEALEDAEDEGQEISSGDSDY
ncbi:hypothetical protein QAD02_006651 [Eretmocerus hayati]|uniref:Uncharacterized protein n=1 Tax=Eretmocerus hayati TaxID=131215 RepID=A0ACC2N1G2_9HYME|nr:hypothetical protein QAD02_006651 [Eretmocerus hayati]